MYQGGILDSLECGDQPNHTMTAIGYGINDNAIDYYIVKNSWGKYWGDEGYMKIAANEGNGICGI